MRIGSLEFSPGRWPTVITLILLWVLVSLGFWQLDRAREKRALLAEYGLTRSTTVFQLEPAMQSFDGLQYQFATANGHYDQARQILLDNRTNHGRVGYEVLTPFIFQGAKAAVLVNRGWVPIGVGREQLPNPGADIDQQQILGRIKVPSKKGFMLGEETLRDSWPYRILQIHTQELARELGYSVLPMVLLLDPDQKDGFVREWNPIQGFGPDRNVGYAVQWFGLASALLIIYIVVNTKKTGT